MAEIDPNTPQVVDPERVVDLTRLLQIRGPLGVLNVLDTIIPVVNMGDVVARTVTVLQPAFRTTDIFGVGVVTAQPAGTVLADTGPLAEGTYDFIYNGLVYSTVASAEIRLEFRNAANTATLASWPNVGALFTSGAPPGWGYTFALELAINERLRAVQVQTLPAGQSAYATLFARRRA